MAWIYANRLLNDHNLTFETLRRPSANVSYVAYFPALLASATFRAALRHIRDSFSVTELMAKPSARLNMFLTLSNTFSL